MPIASVWIDDGCIGCHACEGACPAVFVLPDSEAAVTGDARSDGQTGSNRDERSALRAAIAVEHDEAIREAAAGCPVDVIRFAA